MHYRDPKLIPTILFTALSYLFSLFLISFYTGGDQEHYRAFYEQVRALSFGDGFLVYNAALGSREPIYYIFVFFASRIMEKDIFISIVNTLLLLTIHLLLRKFKPRPWLYLLIYSNFYLFVLFFAAERLKFAALFFLTSFIVRNRFKWIFVALAILSHIQIIIPLLIRPALDFYRRLKNLLKTGRLRLSRNGLLYVFAISLSFALILEQILFKLPYYIQNGGLDSTLKPFLFLFLTLLICRANYSEAIISHFIIILSSFFLGSERIAIYSYFIFLYFFLNYRILNFRFYFLALPSLYFSITGLLFLYKVIWHGNGFHA